VTEISPDCYDKRPSFFTVVFNCWCFGALDSIFIGYRTDLDLFNLVTLGSFIFASSGILTESLKSLRLSHKETTESQSRFFVKFTSPLV
jgi:hypothetical protein